jgi:hypothetical protein
MLRRVRNLFTYSFLFPAESKICAQVANTSNYAYQLPLIFDIEILASA